MARVTGLDDHFLALEPHTQALLLLRMKQKQSAIRRVLIRDLDDPFEYAPDGSSDGDEVSLQPLLGAEQRLKKQLEIASLRSQ